MSSMPLLPQRFPSSPSAVSHAPVVLARLVLSLPKFIFYFGIIPLLFHTPFEPVVAPSAMLIGSGKMVVVAQW